MFTVTGTRAAPINITAAGGISPAGVAREIIFIQGSGGAVDLTANPQIAAGTAVGNELTLICRNAINTVKLDIGTGLNLLANITLALDWAITLIWDGTNWNEISRGTK
jgi:hypothetical protein